MSLRQAIVVATHPEDHSVDLIMLDDGTRHIGVQVATPNGSARSGTIDMPAVPERDNKWDITQATGQDMQALVAFSGRNPVVMGFLYPQINQMLLKDSKARRFRHQSDVETLIDGDGNIQISHPGGTYIRIGESIAADTLAGQYADTSASDRNTGKQVNIHIGMAGGVLTLTMAPDGAVSLTTAKGVAIDAGAAVTIKAPSIEFDTPMVHVTGDVHVDGDVTVDTVSMRHHRHGGVRGGAEITGFPVGGS